MPRRRRFRRYAARARCSAAGKHSLALAQARQRWEQGIQREMASPAIISARSGCGAVQPIALLKLQHADPLERLMFGHTRDHPPHET